MYFIPSSPRKSLVPALKSNHASQGLVQLLMTRCALGLLAALVAVPAHGQAGDYAAPGRLIDVSGRKLHIHCTGSGSPTVLLMVGGGGHAIDWTLVQPQVAESTRVCSYDRAGLGWSDPGPEHETIEQTVSDLHALLRAAGEKGPYVLVGASIGGVYNRAFQRAHPNNVAALVFTNSAGRVGLITKSGGDLLWRLSEDDVRGAFPLPATARFPRPVRTTQPFDRLPADLQPVRLWLDLRLWESLDPTTASPASMLSWRREFLREFEETDNNRQPLGSLPVVVVSSDPVASEAARASRDTLSARLDFLSSNTLHIEASGSGHEIHLFQPARVIEGIARAVSAVRTRAPLTTK
jgi:pimeloyl-ACP methyl ester carboxylesterase